MIRRVICLFVFMIIFFQSTTALSADRKGAFFVRPSIGYYSFASKRNLKDTSIPSISLGYNFEDRWATQFSAAIINTTQKNSIGGASVHGSIFMLDGIYRLNILKQYHPYIMMGPQVISIRPVSGSDPVTQSGASLGVGAAHYFSKSIALSASARDLYTFSGGKNDLMLTVGVSFFLGGE